MVLINALVGVDSLVTVTPAMILMNVPRVNTIVTNQVPDAKILPVGSNVNVLLDILVTTLPVATIKTNVPMVRPSALMMLFATVFKSLVVR